MPRAITTLDDHVLLRAVAEDVPDMALSVREHLRHIADKLEHGERIGSLRCRKCGEATDVTIKFARAAQPNDAKGSEP
mgnify:CR=1 FL=1